MGPLAGGSATSGLAAPLVVAAAAGLLDLNGKHIVLGLTGGIACYKAAELCRALVKEGATVQVVMTEAATEFITPVDPAGAQWAQPVYHSQWDARAAQQHGRTSIWAAQPMPS